jgi:hypothetical protein
MSRNARWGNDDVVAEGGGLTHKISLPLSYHAPCFFFFKPVPRIPTPFGIFLGWVKHIGMWWGPDIYLYNILGVYLSGGGGVGWSSFPSVHPSSSSRKKKMMEEEDEWQQ